MKLIDLAHFRKVNDLTQDDLAEILHVSRGYISQVETGVNNLSDEKIDYLLNYNESSIIDGFVPCFDRLRYLAYRLFESEREHFFKVVKGISPKTEEYPYTLKPLLGVLPEETIAAIRHGRLSITDNVADTITQAFPRVNREWLIQGNGQMFSDNTEENLKSIKEELKEIKIMLTTILERIQ